MPDDNIYDSRPKGTYTAIFTRHGGWTWQPPKTAVFSSTYRNHAEIGLPIHRRRCGHQICLSARQLLASVVNFQYICVCEGSPLSVQF
jgi:hypothetical protein